MQLEHEFTVPVPVEQAWDVLLDIERIAPCMPGAVVDEIRGDEFDGRVKVKVGPITVTYKGTAEFIEKDAENRRAVIKMNGKEARGAGTAAATVTAVLKEAGEETQVSVSTDLAITGKPAQFGRGVMVDVSNKLLGKFVDCLSEQITGGGADEGGSAGDDASSGDASSGSSPASAGSAPTPQRRTQPPRQEPEAIDLLETAGAPMMKALAPIGAAVVVLLLVLGLRRRRNRR